MSAMDAGFSALSVEMLNFIYSKYESSIPLQGLLI